MIVEAYAPYIEELLQSEPWRSAAGDGPPCHGELHWDGSKYWHCQTCGRVGVSTYPVHAAPPNPRRVLIPFAVGLARALHAAPLAYAPAGASFLAPSAG